MLITDQVAIAPSTDPIQVRIPTFGAKPFRDGNSQELQHVKRSQRLSYGGDMRRRVPVEFIDSPSLARPPTNSQPPLIVTIPAGAVT